MQSSASIHNQSWSWWVYAVCCMALTICLLRICILNLTHRESESGFKLIIVGFYKGENTTKIS